MHITEIDLADITLVKVQQGVPHCIKHGAMNKLNRLEDGGGYWRCVHVPSNQNENTCKAGCKHVQLTGFYTMDGNPELWKIAYFPLLHNGKTGEPYEEPRALIERPIPNGTDFREIPLRYLTKA